MSRTWAEIDLDAVKHNLDLARTEVGAGADVLCTVKADAYGHGAIEVSRCVMAHGARMLGVSCADEAAELRSSGILGDILILGALDEAEVKSVVEHGIIPTVSPPEILDSLVLEAKRRDTICPVHVMVDTGMSRAGVPPVEALDLARRIVRSDCLELAGVATHFACADDEDQDVTLTQLQEFLSFVERLGSSCPEPLIIHAANSSATFCVPKSHFQMVRLGIGLYGMSANPAVRRNVNLKPVLSLKARVLYLRRVPCGTPVGYDSTFRTERESLIATLGIGYEDGLPTTASNRAKVIVKGRLAPIVGRVSMDYTTIDVTDIPNVSLGDEAVVLGTQGDVHLSAEDLALCCNRIPYEVTCALGRRVKRVFLNGNAGENRNAYQ